ncbi:hypothetical protein, partial [Bacillus altitudinis]|uniref:hypothetical protein n=1 Tax=Bacillus altitudinis TaxID=293387 RepID=UPI003B51FEFA
MAQVILHIHDADKPNHAPLKYLKNHKHQLPKSTKPLKNSNPHKINLPYLPSHTHIPTTNLPPHLFPQLPFKLTFTHLQPAPISTPIPTPTPHPSLSPSLPN